MALESSRRRRKTLGFRCPVEVLNENMDGDEKRAARTLGISLETLYNRLNVYEAAAGRDDTSGD